MSYELAETMAKMGLAVGPEFPRIVRSDLLEHLPAGSMLIRVRNSEVVEMYPRRGRAYAGLVPDEWWIVIWKGQPCLICSQFGTHRFSVLGGPEGWLCEEHKDDPVEVDGITYGEKARR